MILSFDFDATIVEDKYPEIGELLPNAKEVITYLFNRAHEIIIDSCRTGDAEKQMKGFLKYNDIPFDYINKNSVRRIKQYGTDTRKISCDISIDDKNLFIANDIVMKGKSFVDQYLWQNIDSIMLFCEKPLVICVIGESGSGKSMVAEYFEYQYGVNLIQSYTDRPRRFSGEKGHTFLSPRQMEKVCEGDMLAYTEFGGYKYCCLYDDIKHANCYVIDEDGFEMLKKNWNEVLDIYSIRIHRDYDKRVESAGKERVERDKGRFKLPNKTFDLTIQNLTDDKNIVYAEIDNFVKQYRFTGRFEPYETLIIDDGSYED